MTQNLENRITTLEAKQENMEKGIAEIKSTIGLAATKTDLKNLREFFERRDSEVSKNLWWCLKAFIILLISIALSTFGLDKIPTLFGI